MILWFGPKSGGLDSSEPSDTASTSRDLLDLRD
jgi:hypothetical protein